MAFPLKVKLELRAITNNHLNRESAVMISSTMPSEKYSCSGSPLMFVNGSTAMVGFTEAAASSSGRGDAPGGALVSDSVTFDSPTSGRMRFFLDRSVQPLGL